MNNSQNICPLCGQLNKCTQAGASTPVASCWCFAEKISADVLKSIPAAIDRSCICPRCAKGLPPSDAPIEAVPEQSN